MRAALVAMCVIVGASSAEAQLSDLERQRLLAHLEVTGAAFISEISGLSPAQLAFKPSRTAWSIAEVIDHILVVGPIYWDDLQRALTATPSKATSAFTDADILWYGIDRGNPEKAVAAEVPAGKFRELAPAMVEYRKNHARLAEFIKTTDADLRAHIVPRQGSDAYQWALLISTHEQRHILQIREIKSASGFPR